MEFKVCWRCGKIYILSPNCKCSELFCPAFYKSWKAVFCTRKEVFIKYLKQLIGK